MVKYSEKRLTDLNIHDLREGMMSYVKNVSISGGKVYAEVIGFGHRFPVYSGNTDDWYCVLRFANNSLSFITNEFEHNYFVKTCELMTKEEMKISIKKKLANGLNKAARKGFKKVNPIIIRFLEGR